MSNHNEPVPDLRAWRANRDRGWSRDVGYSLQDVLGAHHYDLSNKGSRPEDPGWHTCRCGWEGYWIDFHPHVADHLRGVVIPASGMNHTVI